MIKRPLLILFFSFLLGTISYTFSHFVISCILCFLILFDLLSLYFHVYSKWLSKEDKILLLLPVLYICGFTLMYICNQKYPIDTKFDSTIACDVTGKISKMESKGEYLFVTITKIQIQVSDQVYDCGKILASIKSDHLVSSMNCAEDSYHIGNIITCTGNLIKFEHAGNRGQFDEANYYKGQGYDYKMQVEFSKIVDHKISWLSDKITRIRNRFLASYRAILNDEDYGLVVAMLLGETSYIQEELQELYRSNGIAHLLAISGLHITFLGMGIYQLLSKLKLSGVIKTIIVSIFILFYGALTGFSVSTNRAILMLLILLWAKVIGRTYDGKSAMTLAAFLILIQNPMQIFQIGFQLSFGAIFGILFINDIIQKAIEFKRKFAQTLSMSVSIQVATLPMVLSVFYEFPLYSVFLNLFILPLSSLLIALSVFAGILSLVSTTMGGFLIGGVHYILQLIHISCLAFVKLPGCTQTWGMPKIGQVIIFYALIILILFVMYYLTRLRKIIYENSEDTVVFQTNQETVDLEGKLMNGILVIDRTKKGIRCDDLLKENEFYVPRKFQKQMVALCLKKSSYIIGLILLICSMIIFYPRKEKELIITMLDVGQGDGIYLETMSGTNYLIDGGSSSVRKLAKYRLIPFLKSRGKTSLDYAIVTHMDLDHTSGLIELITNGYEIKHLLLPDIIKRGESYEELVQLAKSASIPIFYISRGSIIKDGEVCITCLHPTKEFEPSSENSYSTVLSVSYGDFRMLLTGDVEAEGEQALLEYLLQEKEKNDFDVLKVAHHGSKNSTKENLLDLIKPEYSLISVGKKNRYGHPSKEVIERLKKVNSQIYSTMDCGAITIQTDGRRMKIIPYRK